MINLTIEDKARLTFEADIAFAARNSHITPEEKLRQWCEESKKAPEELLNDYVTRFRTAHSFIDELIRNGGYKIRGGVPILNLKTRENERDPTKPESNVITNVGEFMGGPMLLDGFVGVTLPNYFFKPLIYRNVRARTFSDTKKERTKNLKSKITQVLETGFDKPLDSQIWMSHYADKVLEYSQDVWPKLITVYDRNGVEYLKGVGEGYEWRFLRPPRELLQCFVSIDKTSKK